jgi:hypothetical protein
MACSQVVDGGDGFQIWSVAKQLWTVDKGLRIRFIGTNYASDA